MNLEELAKHLESLYTTLLFGGETPALDLDPEEIPGERVTLDCIAELELCSALEFLRQAQYAAMRAHYHQVRAVAASPYRP